MSNDPSAAEARVRTRRSLHAVAEQVLAAHQYRTVGTIRLTVSPGGFTTRRMPGHPARLAVREASLVVDDDHALPLTGTLGELAEAAGVQLGSLDDLYADGSGAGPAHRLEVDPASAADLVALLDVGDTALRTVSARSVPDAPPEPVLWPEHFDLGITVEGVNLGLSLGDGAIPEPYAYVGPDRPRSGRFWNQPFGAAWTLDPAPTQQDLVAFWDRGLRQARTDPLA